jgi:hypothetical protein
MGIEGCDLKVGVCIITYIRANPLTTLIYLFIGPSISHLYMIFLEKARRLFVPIRIRKSF